MAGVLLKSSDRPTLLRRMRRQTNSVVHQRANVLLLLDDGGPIERIAEALYIDPETVREHKRLFESAGVAGIERLAYVGREPPLSQNQLEARARGPSAST